MAGTSYMRQQAIDERDRAEASLREAERLRDLADNRLGQLQRISGEMLAIYDEIDTTPGQLKTGDALVSSAIATLESLGETAQRDPVIALELADAYDRIGEIQGGNRHANFGRIDEALVSFTKSKEIYALHAPGSTRAAVGSGRASIKIADVLKGKGDTPGALARYQESAAIAEEVLQEEPNNRDAKRLRASALLSVADTMWDTGRRNESEAMYAESVLLREGLARGPAADSLNTRDLAIGLARLGRARLAAGDPSGAIELYMRSRTLRASLQEQAGDEDLRARRDIFIIDLQIAQAHGMLGDLTKRRDSLRAGCDVAATLVELDPDDQRAKRDLAVALERLGDGESDLGNLTKARDVYIEAVEAVRIFRIGSPNSQTGVRLEMSSKYRLGNTHAELGNSDAARPYLDQAERLVNENTGLDAPFRLQMLGAIAMARGVASASADDFRQAAAQFQLALSRYNDLPVEARQDFSIRVTIADLTYRRAEALSSFDLRSSQAEAARARSEFVALGESGQHGAAEAEALACEVDMALGELNAPEAVNRMTLVIVQLQSPPERALRRLAKAHFEAGSRAAAIEVVDQALRQLANDPKEGWSRAKLQASLVDDRARYSASEP
jgi:tetratricopeptide (TPR) repeat protein